MIDEAPSPMVLRMLMWDRVEQAAHDMPDAAASELFTRFLCWAGDG